MKVSLRKGLVIFIMGLTPVGLAMVSPQTVYGQRPSLETKNYTRELILPFEAEKGDGSKVQVILRMGRQATAEGGEIIGFKGSKFHGKIYSEATKGDEIVVSGGQAITTANLGVLGNRKVRITGEFFVTKSLNLVSDGQWDGKKPGATHTITGKITMLGHIFVSDSRSPLKFKVTQKGYKYVEGIGTVKDLATGTTYSLGK